MPGVAGPTAPLAPAVRDALRSATAGRTRIASICVGVFPLAARAPRRTAGHDALARGRPAGRHHRTSTSTGTSSRSRPRPVPHLGRCGRRTGPVPAYDPPWLQLGRRRPPVGHAVEREGAEVQFIVSDPRRRRSPSWRHCSPGCGENPARDLTLVDIAERAGTSTRTLTRRFRDETGRWRGRGRLRGCRRVPPRGFEGGERRAVRSLPGRWRPTGAGPGNNPARRTGSPPLAPARVRPRPPASARPRPVFPAHPPSDRRLPGPGTETLPARPRTTTGPKEHPARTPPRRAHTPHNTAGATTNKEVSCPTPPHRLKIKPGEGPVVSP